MDLTPIVEAAAAGVWAERTDPADPTPWAEVPPLTQFRIREAVLPVVEAALPAIREALALEIEAQVEHIAEGSDLRYIHDDCAKIVRGF